MTARLETNAEPLPGYRLIERLGGGGFGEVWKCEAPGGLHKAIKFVYGDLQSTEDAERPEQELKALARVKTVRHPYILSLERYDIIDGQLLIVMELADRNLWDRFKECRSQGLPGIPRDELLGYMEEIAEALDLMNIQYQLQHLDIKPQNLFLIHNHIKVADFGLVKDLAGLETKVTGGITPVYAAPETFDGVVSRHSDQYSLAICYQELLTGQRPFSASNIRQLILQHLQGEPNVSTLPERDQPVILRGLSKVPTDRFPTCQELVHLLRREPAAVPAAVPDAPPAVLGEPPATQFTPGPIVPSQVGTDPDLGTTQSLRALEAAAPLTTDSGRLLAPAEVAGDGCLFPTLVIGLGQTGLRVLRRLRERLVEQAGGLDALPNVKLLLIDTDPDAPRAAVQARAADKPAERGGSALQSGEVHLAPLNRPSHYLKGRDGQPSLETWLPPRLVYRIPRSQVTTGVRALGRLAFCDNYRALRHRLDADLDRVLDPAGLQRAAKATKLGLRSNRPRVYVVASLAGGTGGGMFLDLAYTLRALLKKRGYDQPDVVAVLFAPDAEHARPGSPAVVNTVASLAELRHFATPGTTFTARYHDKEPALRDAEPPFSRTVLLRLPDEGDDAATREAHDLAGQLLYRDVATPLGRTADLGRAGLSGPPWAERGLYFETVGLYRLSWPRRELLHEIARHLCLRLVARWMSKDSKPVASRVTAFVKAQWRDHNLGPEVFIERVRERLAERVRKDPETTLAALVEPLLRSIRATPPPPPKRWGQGTPPAFEIPAEELGVVMEEVERLVGRPAEETLHDQAGELGGPLRASVEELTAAWSQKLAEVTVRLLEEPDYRLAGAEEAVRQVLALLEQVLQRYEPLGKDLDGQARQAHRTLLEFQAGRGRQFGLSQDEAIALVRSYPKLRLQSLILHQVVQAFLCLRGHLSDELREIGYCRDRLSELHRSLDALGPPLPGKSHPGRAVKTLGPEIAGRPAAEHAGGRVLLPGGCRSLDEAVARVVGDVGPDLLLELDARVEEMIRRDYKALVHVCMNSAITLKEVERALLGTAADYAAGHLADTNVAELFLQQTHSTGLQVAELETCLTEAEPKLRVEGRGRPGPGGPMPSQELVILVRPACESGDRIQELTAQAAPGREVHSSPGGEDLVFYRERVHLGLDQLDHLAGPARDAYRAVVATAHLTPHARVDIDFSAAVEEE